MTQHDHREFVEGCYRCDLSRDEVSEYTPTIEENRRDALMRVIRIAVEQPGRWTVGRPIDEAVADAVIAWIDRAGVVAEEPEWEYGFQLRESDSGDVYDQETGFDTAQDATDAGTKRIHDEDDDEYPPLALRLIRRAKAGPWVPVKQEGADDA